MYKKLLEKFKTINWKSKKSIIAYAIILAVLVGGTGTGLAVNYFNNNSDIVKTDVKDKATSKPADDKKEDKKSDDKKDTDKKDENSKPTENKKEDKKDTNETSKTNDNKINNSTNKTPVNNNNTSSSNSSNNGNNTSPTPPPANSSGGNTTPQPPSNNGNNNNNNSGNNKPTEPENPTPPPHTHSWYDLTEPQEQFTTVTKTICNEPTCREDFTGWKQADVDQHTLDHLLKGENGGYHNEDEQVSLGFIDVVVGRQCACGVKERF